MINDALALTYDFGTQSVRAIVFDKVGNILGKRKIEYSPPYFSVEPGWAEQDAEMYWKSMCKAGTELRAELGEEIFARIKTVSVTTFRDVVVCLDKNRNVLRPVILWLDQRRFENPLEGISKARLAVFNLVGVTETVKMQRAASFCNWISKNEPEVWAKTDKFVQFSAYIYYKLTGRLADSVASNIGHFPFDYKKKRWMKGGELTACVFNARPDQMCELVEPCEKVGVISREVALLTGLPEGVPVIAGGSDKGCETLGTGCIGNDVASLSLGTSATAQITTDKYVAPQPYLPAYPSMFSDKFNPEIQIFRGYWMITWFKKEFATKEVKEAERFGILPEVLLDQRLTEIPPGSRGLILQPFWSPGVRTPEAKGSIIGFTDEHTRVHLYRAIIEGIGYALYDGIKKMEKRAGFEIKRLMVSGGGANSDAICQITADLMGMTVQKIQTYETSALGAAMAAFVGAGEFENLKQAVQAMSHITKQYFPNQQAHAMYDRLYNNVYKKLYKANKKFYTEIGDALDSLDNSEFKLIKEINYDQFEKFEETLVASDNIKED